MQLDAGYFREEPGAGKPHARICEGEAEWISYSTIPQRGIAQDVFSCRFLRGFLHTRKTFISAALVNVLFREINNS